MSYSGIGGQAVMEGVMMKNREKYAVAVRKPNKEIEVKITEKPDKAGVLREIPVVRGVVAFIDSLSVGMETLMYSASFFEEDEEMKKSDKKPKKELTDEQKARRDKAEMTVTMVISFAIALLIFFVGPYYLSEFLGKYIESALLLALIEGLIRITVFIIYILLISQMSDIKRTFMYHGAEHKCINCIENGKELTVGNVREASRFHKRCGTSFIFIVLIVSILAFMFIRFDAMWMKLVVRLVCIPVIAGVSYEFIRLAGRSESKLVGLLSAPGLLFQRLTTKEPTDDMIEVAIASVEAVFDWEEFILAMEDEKKKTS